MSSPKWIIISTPWCAGMVVVPKKEGAIRICVDLKPLNGNVFHEVHPLPKVDETLAQLAGAAVFSKLDANSGFWQIPLAKKSRLLTTFITPFGRYCFNKMPFGISSAPEHFQKKISEILRGLDGVLCLMDDVLVYGINETEHDQRLMAALTKIQTARVTLNPKKCEFQKKQLKFLGQLVGIRADPEKTAAITTMKAPTNISELGCFIGMINQLGKFSQNLADFTQPLRQLLSKTSAWYWGPDQEQAFARIKRELSQLTVLTLYNPQAHTKVCSDASSYGVGTVLMQKSDSTWKPVAFASRTLTKTEKRYAQIEKEARLQKRNYDRHHGTRSLSPIPDDSGVWVTSTDQPVSGTVISPADTPRSYMVETPAGLNRQHLNQVPKNERYHQIRKRLLENQS